MSESKGQFNSNIGFIMASVGSAVGLGNLWGFPYKMGTNGGFAFLLLYLILAVFVGASVMLAEFVIGRGTGKGPVEAFREIGQQYTFLGYFAVAASICVLSFYCCLGGYTIKYWTANLIAIFTHGGIFTVSDTATYFMDFVGSGLPAVVCTAVFIIINLVIVLGGVSGGIEKFTTIAMPALFVMLVIVIVKAITLPGSSAGLLFMYKPNWEVFSGTGWISVLAAAGGQMFFSLSLGMAVMITYGSYLSKKENLVSNAIIVTVCDTLVALMAGLAVFPAVFAMGFEPASGPGLLFITLQSVFNTMGAIGPIFGFLLYFLVFIAAITSSISLLEGQTSTLIDARIRKGQPYNRTALAAVMSLVALVTNTITTIDGLGTGPLPQPLGMCWLDFFDLLGEGILMPLGSLIVVALVGWVWKIDFIDKEVSIEGNQLHAKGFWNFCFKITAPLGMAMILLGQIDGFFGLGIFG